MKRRSVKRVLAAALALGMLLATTAGACAEELEITGASEALTEEASEAFADTEDAFVPEDAAADEEVIVTADENYAEEAAEADDAEAEEAIDADAAAEITDAEEASDAEEILPEDAVDVITEEDVLTEEDAPALLTEEDAVSEEALLSNVAEDADATVEEASDTVNDEALGFDVISETDRLNATLLTLNKSQTFTQEVAVGVIPYYYKFELKSASPIYLSLASSDIDVLKYDFICYDEKDNQWEMLYGAGDRPEPGYARGNNAVGWRINPDMPPWTDKYKVTKFIKGTYYLVIRADGEDRVGKYNLMISTKAPKKIKSMKLNKKEAALFTGGTIQMEAKVSPSGAYDPSVTWKSSNSEYASVDPETGLVTAKAPGTTTIKAITNSQTAKGKQIEKTCTVTVLEGAYEEIGSDDLPVNMITKQKITLSDAAYFNKTWDKYTVEEGKKYGSVKKGVFTSKKAGLVHIKGYMKVSSKLYCEAASLTLNVLTPDTLYPAGTTVHKVTKKGEEIQIADHFSTGTSLITPTDYSIKGVKKGNFVLDKATGKLTVVSSGKCTVYAHYGDGAKYGYKVSATIPKYKKAAVSVMEGKTATITLKSVAGDAVTAWTSEGYNETDKTPNGEAQEFFTASAETKSKSSRIVKVTGVKAGTGTLIATIDGVQYVCVVTVKP